MAATDAPDDEQDPPTWTAAAAAAAVPVGNPSVPDASADADDAVFYTTSPAFGCPPLVKLQAYGLCCPFLETEEDHDARDCVNNLQNYPITWYRKKRVEDVANDAQRAVPSTGGIMKGLGEMLGTSGKKAEIPMVHVGVPSTLTVVDTEEHGPLIEIRALEVNDPNNTAAREALNKYVTGGKPWWEDPIIKEAKPSKVIPLYVVDKVAAGWSLTNDSTAGGVKLHSAPKDKSFLSSGMGPELLRFDTLGGGGSLLGNAFGPVTLEEPNKHSDKVIVQLKSLLDWNRRRMAQDIKKGRVGVAPKAGSPGYVAMT